MTSLARHLLAIAVAGSCSTITSMCRASEVVSTWSALGGGDWTTGGNWSTNPVFPNDDTQSGTGYQTVLPSGASSYVVTVNSNITVDQITLGDSDSTRGNYVSLVQDSGTLFAGAIDSTWGEYTVVGGSLDNTKLSLFQVDVIGNATFQNVQSDSLSMILASGSALTLSGTTFAVSQPPVILAPNGGGTVILDGSLGSLSNAAIIGGTVSSPTLVEIGGPDATAPVILTIKPSGGLGPHTVGKSFGTGFTALGSFNVIDGHTASTLINNGVISGDGAFNYEPAVLNISTSAFTNNSSAYVYNGSTLTIDSLSWNNSNGGTIAANYYQGGLSAAPSVINMSGTWTNSGTILSSFLSSSSQAFLGPTATLNLSGNWSNIGTVQTGGNTSINFSGAWNNSGSIKIAGTTSWNLSGVGINSGSLSSAANATLNLLNSFTLSQLGTLNLAPTTSVFLQGTLNLAGSTFALNSSTGNWNLDGGTLVGGVVQESPGYLFQDFVGGVLDNVAITGNDLIMADNAGSLTIRDGLNVSNHNVSLGTHTTLLFDGPGTLVDNLNVFLKTGSNKPTAAIIFGGPNTPENITFTLGANAVLHGDSNAGTLTLNASAGATVVNNGVIGIGIPGGAASGGKGLFFISPANLVNNATIICGTSVNPGGQIELNAASFTNDGTVQVTSATLDIDSIHWNNDTSGTLVASSGSNLTIELGGQGTWNNSGAMAVSASTLELCGTWASTGTIAASNASSVSLMGSFSTSSLAGLTASSNSSVSISGNVNNSGSTLMLPVCSNKLYGGTITGGILDQTPGRALAFSYATLNGVRITGDDLRVSGSLSVTNGITVDDGKIDLSGSGSLSFNTFGQTLSSTTLNCTGFAQLLLIGAVSLPLAQSGPALILNPASILHGTVTVSPAYLLYTSLSNQGLIDADIPGTSITFGTPRSASPQIALTNSGTLEANGGTLDMTKVSLNNSGLIRLVNKGIIDAPAGIPSTGLIIGTGSLSGWGTINGNLNLSAGSTFDVSIAGVLAGGDYGVLTVDGNVMLGGDLDLSVPTGVQPSLLADQTFDVMTIGLGYGFSGAFGNVVSGSRLSIDDGGGSFLVTYGGGGPNSTQVILSDYQSTVPEPDINGASCVLAALTLRRRRRSGLRA
jgi:hypothetical protein